MVSLVIPATKNLHRSRSRQLSFDQPVGAGAHDHIDRFLGVLALRSGDLIEPRLLGLGLVVLLPVALELLLQLAAGLAVGIEKKRNPVDRPVARSNTAGTPYFCFAAVALTKCSCGPQPVGVLL